MKRTDRTGITGRGGVRVRLTAGAVGFAVVLAACSSSNAGPAPEPPVTDSSTPATEAPTSTTTSTTVAPTTTTKPPPVVDTVASSDPSPETTTGDSLPAPTNTTFDPTTLEGEVERAVLANLAAFVVCLEELPNCDVEKATANALFAYGEGNAKLMNEWNAAGYEARDTADYNFRVDEIEFPVDGTEALVIACVWGGTQLVVPATDTSPEVIVDDEYTSSTNRYLVRKIGDVWFVTANDPLERSVGAEQNICV